MKIRDSWKGYWIYELAANKFLVTFGQEHSRNNNIHINCSSIDEAHHAIKDCMRREQIEKDQQKKRRKIEKRDKRLQENEEKEAA